VLAPEAVGSAVREVTNLGQGRAPPGVVDDVGHNTLDVPMALGEVLRGGREGRRNGGEVVVHSHGVPGRDCSPWRV